MNEEEVKDYLFEQFLFWMTGQTVSINNDGSTDFYRSDVERFATTGTKSRVWD
jgi:hypothetical protein